MKMKDQTYAEWHRDCMNKTIDIQDAEVKRRRAGDYDYYLIRGMSALIVLAAALSIASYIKVFFG